MLCRFSKARAYEPKATIEMLTNYFAWRDEYKVSKLLASLYSSFSLVSFQPELVEPSEITDEVVKQKVYMISRR